MRHSGTEYGYLISGELELNLGFDKYPLTAGDSVCFASTKPHGYRNDGEIPAVGVLVRGRAELIIEVLARPVDLIMVRWAPTPSDPGLRHLLAVRGGAAAGLSGSSVRGDARPWTADPILATYRFTNCYRAADRVEPVLDQGSDLSAAARTRTKCCFGFCCSGSSTASRPGSCCVRPLVNSAGRRSAFDRYDHVLTKRVSAVASGIYSAAYVDLLRPGSVAYASTRDHLLPARAHAARRTAVQIGGQLRRWQRLSIFCAAIPESATSWPTDFSSTSTTRPCINFDEMDFVVPGPGAKDGLRKCFGRGVRALKRTLIR